MLKHMHRYIQDPVLRACTITNVSTGINACMGTAKLLIGVFASSTWFIVNAVYYLTLCLARVYIIKKYRTLSSIEEMHVHYQEAMLTYRRSGFAICCLAFVYFGVCMRMYLYGDSAIYQGWMIFGVATISFMKIGLSIYGVITTRHMKDPLLSTIKIISFIDAVVSIVITQCILLIMEHSPQAVSSSAVFGMGCSLMFLCIGLMMMRKQKSYTEIVVHRKQQSDKQMKKRTRQTIRQICHKQWGKLRKQVQHGK